MKRRMPVFVGCEGDSERSYVRWLQSRLDETGLTIHLDSYIAGGGDPLAVIEDCVDECLRRQRIYGPYKVRAVLLDSDKLGEDPRRDAKIQTELRRGRIASIYQVFDHEALLLRHFDGHQTKRPAKKRSITALKKVWRGYEKPADAKELSRWLDLPALQRAYLVEPDLRAFLQALGFAAPQRKRRR